MCLHKGHGLESREAVHSCWHFSKCHKIDYTKTRHPLISVQVVTCHVAVTMKITGPWTMAGKTHIGLVNLYIIVFKIRKPESNSGLVRQKPKSFNGDCMFKKYHDRVLMVCCRNATWAIRTQIVDKNWHLRPDLEVMGMSRLFFLHARPWIPGDEKSIFTVVIH